MKQHIFENLFKESTKNLNINSLINEEYYSVEKAKNKLIFHFLDDTGQELYQLPARSTINALDTNQNFFKLPTLLDVLRGKHHTNLKYNKETGEMLDSITNGNRYARTINGKDADFNANVLAYKNLLKQINETLTVYRSLADLTTEPIPPSRNHVGHPGYTMDNKFSSTVKTWVCENPITHECLGYGNIDDHLATSYHDYFRKKMSEIDITNETNHIGEKLEFKKLNVNAEKNYNYNVGVSKYYFKFFNEAGVNTYLIEWMKYNDENIKAYPLELKKYCYEDENSAIKTLNQYSNDALREVAERMEGIEYDEIAKAVKRLNKMLYKYVKNCLVPMAEHKITEKLEDAPAYPSKIIDAGFSYYRYVIYRDKEVFAKWTSAEPTVMNNKMFIFKLPEEGDQMYKNEPTELKQRVDLTSDELATLAEKKRRKAVQYQFDNGSRIGGKYEVGFKYEYKFMFFDKNDNLTYEIPLDYNKISKKNNRIDIDTIDFLNTFKVNRTGSNVGLSDFHSVPEIKEKFVQLFKLDGTLDNYINNLINEASSKPEVETDANGVKHEADCELTYENISRIYFVRKENGNIMLGLCDYNDTTNSRMLFDINIEELI